MSAFTAAWIEVRRLKEITDIGAVPANVRSVAAAAEHGEAWMRVLLTEHGLGGEGDIDAVTTIEGENAITTLRNLASMELGLAVVSRVMHASGFTNGLALGLTLSHVAEIERLRSLLATALAGLEVLTDPDPDRGILTYVKREGERQGVPLGDTYDATRELAALLRAELDP